MANAKSARPEWRASVSRIKQTARVSIISAEPPYATPPIAYFNQPPSPNWRTSLRESEIAHNGQTMNALAVETERAISRRGSNQERCAELDARSAAAHAELDRAQ